MVLLEDAVARRPTKIQSEYRAASLHSIVAAMTLHHGCLAMTHNARDGVSDMILDGYHIISLHNHIDN